MRVISWNVNGVRSVHKKGFLEWFATASPDILCLQETRALPSQFPPELKTLPLTEFHSSSAVKPGYSGVATWGREKFLDTKILGVEEMDNEGRTLIHDVGPFFLLNCYFPNGQRDHSRVPFKMRYCQSLQEKVRELRRLKPVAVTGDFNTAHHTIDLANASGNKNTTGFLPQERAWLDEFAGEGMVDVFRHQNPAAPGHYTWWSNRPGCRARNIGWRIDYFFVSQDLMPHVVAATIHADVLGSDHCPISLELKF